MPACTTESLTKLWNNRDCVNASLENSGSLPSSPNSTSPINSPVGTLRRSRSTLSNSSDFFPEHFVIKSDWRNSNCVKQKQENKSILVKIIGWYPCFLLQVLQAAIAIFLPAACVRLLIALPTLWISMWFWIFWKIMDFPLTIFKWCLCIMYSPTEALRKKRTILISGGSSIQALHLARNFYTAGARVVVCEVEGLFALSKFSTAVSKFYTIPKPTGNSRNYVKALCDIVEKEEAIYYVPVNVSTPAVFDAKAKPVLELLGCTCFCPGVNEVMILDDIMAVFNKCIESGLPTPAYYSITSRSKLAQLYQNGTMRTNRYLMSNCGPSSSSERMKFVLPRAIEEIKLPGEISEAKPWVVIEDQNGQHLVTCTTVKQNQVIANVTCKLDENKCLIPVNHKEVDQWLQVFFSKINLTKSITGHFTFRFVVTKNNTILPLGCKVGISLPYICHTSVHPKLLLKPCKHFNRQSSGPLVVNKGRYWLNNALFNVVQKPSVDSVTRLIGTVLDKREVLFIYWDPLPYCAYYHMQLPLRNALEFLHRRRFDGALTAPVQ